MKNKKLSLILAGLFMLSAGTQTMCADWSDYLSWLPFYTVKKKPEPVIFSVIKPSTYPKKFSDVQREHVAWGTAVLAATVVAYNYALKPIYNGYVKSYIDAAYDYASDSLSLDVDLKNIFDETDQDFGLTPKFNIPKKSIELVEEPAIEDSQNKDNLLDAFGFSSDDESDSELEEDKATPSTSFPSASLKSDTSTVETPASETFVDKIPVSNVDASLFDAFDFSSDDSDSEKDDAGDDELDVPKKLTFSHKASIKINGTLRHSVRIANKSLRHLTLMRADSFDIKDQRLIFRIIIAMNERGSREIQNLLKRLTIKNDEKLYGLLYVLEGTRQFVFEACDAWNAENPKMQSALAATGIKGFVRKHIKRNSVTDTLFDQLNDFLIDVRRNKKFMTEFVAKIMESDELENYVLARENVINNAVEGVVATIPAELKKAVLKKIKLKELQTYLATYLNMVTEEEVQALFFNDVMEHVNNNYLDDGTHIDPATPRGKNSLRKMSSIFNVPAIEVEDPSNEDDDE